MACGEPSRSPHAGGSQSPRDSVTQSSPTDQCVDDLVDFDLILTMDDANLSAVRSLSDEMGGRATAELKTMLSFARNFTETEVPDPYYGGEAGFEHVLDLLDDSCSALLDELTAGE